MLQNRSMLVKGSTCYFELDTTEGRQWLLGITANRENTFLRGFDFLPLVSLKWRRENYNTHDKTDDFIRGTCQLWMHESKLVSMWKRQQSGLKKSVLEHVIPFYAISVGCFSPSLAKVLWITPFNFKWIWISNGCNLPLALLTGGSEALP